MKNNICRNGHLDAHFIDAHGRKDCKACSQQRVKNFELKRLYGNNREAAIMRDGEKCVRCDMTREEHRIKYGKDITVDHIDGRGINTPANQKNNAINNLQTLCFACHGHKDRKRYLELVG